jgi:deoxycytidine triphosphate deaminase
MIEPFDPKRLRAASYQLTLGKEVHIGGKQAFLEELKPLVLEKHQVAVVSTAETIRIPRFLIARWSLRVTDIYRGLLWTGGPQVDPGWAGQLFCPVYNLGEQDIELRAGQPFFTMDFTRTTPLSAPYMELHKEPGLEKTWFTPVRRTLAEHDEHRLHSAPYEALKDLRELTQFRSFAIGSIGLLITVLGVIVAALAVVSVEPSMPAGGQLLDFWPMTALVGSTVAIVLSACSLAITYFGLRKRH